MITICLHNYLFLHIIFLVVTVTIVLLGYLQNFIVMFNIFMVF